MKGSHSWDDAMKVAQKVCETLEPYVEKIEVCGSLRRERTIVGDVDIVVAGVKDGFVGAFYALIEQNPDMNHKGSAVIEFNAVVDGVSVDVSVVKIEGWGAALCHATGPAGENIRLRAKAKKLGMKLNEYGLFKGGVRIAGLTENEVYAALGEPYVTPTERDRTGLNLKRGLIV